MKTDQASNEPRPQVEHLNPPGLHVNPAFSQVVTVAGPHKTVYVGGQNALNAQGEIVGRGDLARQTEQALANLETALAAAGAAMDQIVKWNIYMVQGQSPAAGFAAFQRLQVRLANPPAITVLIVAGLANPEFLVEIEAVAVTPVSGVTAPPAH